MKQSEKSSEKLKPFEEPYDIETVFCALKIASDGRKEMIFMDRLLNYIRANPNSNLSDASFEILKSLRLLNLPVE